MSFQGIYRPASCPPTCPPDIKTFVQNLSNKDGEQYWDEMVRHLRFHLCYMMERTTNFFVTAGVSYQRFTDFIDFLICSKKKFTEEEKIFMALLIFLTERTGSLTDEYIQSQYMKKEANPKIENQFARITYRRYFDIGRFIFQCIQHFDLNGLPLNFEMLEDLLLLVNRPIDFINSMGWKIFIEEKLKYGQLDSNDLFNLVIQVLEYYPQWATEDAELFLSV